MGAQPAVRSHERQLRGAHHGGLEGAGGAQPDESMVEMAVALKAEHDEGQGPSVPDQAKVVKLMTQLAALSSD